MGQEGLLTFLYTAIMVDEADCRHALCALVGRHKKTLYTPCNMTHVDDGDLPWNYNDGDWDCYACDGKCFSCCQIVNVRLSSLSDSRGWFK